jgi:nitroimidazol reductase NimA-like FMN-containing flavoprotein (pyridoxamine 5'-phosphate oxidase superfamily)
MNRRDEIKLTQEEAAKFLHESRKVDLATIDKDGFPHLVAMNFVDIDGAVYMTSYGKAQKVINIRRNPKVAVMAERGKSYSELRGLMIRGECEVIEDPAIVRWIMQAIREHEGANTPMPDIPDRVSSKRVVLKVIPKKTTSWDHSKLGGRY